MAEIPFPDEQLEPPAVGGGGGDSEITKLIVAVHGIGDQFRFATIQSVARQIAEFCKTPIAFPLGRFHAPGGKVQATPFDIPNAGVYPKKCTEVERAALDEAREKLKGLGFAEVFWADIHQEAQKTGDTIEESKSWAQTMVNRMAALAAAPAQPGAKRVPAVSVNYKKTAAVVEEMIETIATLENLCFIAEKMGLGKFELRSLLDDYLGAVQLVAEFKDYGGSIFDRFSGIMRDLLEAHPKVESIYIVAHSEGTVVSFYSLLAALSKLDPKHAAADLAWVEKVRGYMTIGSPIDKHIVMWPELWNPFRAPNRVGWKRRAVAMKHGPIQWWNYYDKGDPVGFKLDSARLWMQDHCWVKAELAPGDKQPFFHFPEEQDRGFTRYYLPGEAHNEYWNDPGVFGHFISKVMLGREDNKNYPVPMGKFWPGIVSWVLPYVLAFLILMGGTYLIYRAVDPFLQKVPGNGSVQAASETLAASASTTDLLAAQLAQSIKKAADDGSTVAAAKLTLPQTSPDTQPPAKSKKNIAAGVFALAMLLAGITVASRIPRLVKLGLWHVVAGGIFILGAEAYVHCVPTDAGERLAGALFWIPLAGGGRMVALALVIAVASSLFSKCKPHWGMRPLIVLSGLATLWIVGYLLFGPGAAGKDAPLWPLVLAGAAFLYLWWLAALIFDLVFVWHRYIRSNATPEILMAIRERRRTDVYRSRATRQ